MSYGTSLKTLVAKAIAAVEYGDGYNNPWEPFEAQSEAALLCVLENIVADNVTFDLSLEQALQSEGIWAWGPDGEKFERMLRAFVSSAQAIEAGTAKTEGLGPKDESAVHAPEGVFP